MELKEDLLKKRYHFRSETDTEVIAHLCKTFMTVTLPVRSVRC